jgi:hypothetical protein
MSDRRNPNPPPDVSLLLRAHAEQRWLSGEVIPVVRQVEHPERLPDEQLPAAVAYLEVIWIEAMGRSRETEAARCHLDEWECPAHPLPGQPLATRARSCHAAVRTLREAAARRVAPLLAVPAELGGPAGYPVASSFCRR